MEVEKTVAEKKPVRKKAAASVTIGVISNCEKLNIRKTPEVSDNIIKILEAGTEIKIDPTFESIEYYKICDEEAYCMKKFIKLQ